MRDPSTDVPAVRADRQEPGPNLVIVAGIDRRIVEADPREAMEWIKVRQAVLVQDEGSRDRDHLRRVEILGIYGKIGLSAAAMASGVALAFGGFGLPAFVCLGAGLYGLAPEFIRTVTRRVVGGKDGSHGS